MSKNRTKQGVLQSYLIALGISTLSLIICTLAAAIILYSSKDPTGSIGIASLITLICSAAVSGIVISRFKGEGGVKFAGLSSLALIFILLIIGVILGSSVSFLGAFMNYACYLGTSLFAAYLGKKREKRRRR